MSNKKYDSYIFQIRSQDDWTLLKQLYGETAVFLNFIQVPNSTFAFLSLLQGEVLNEKLNPFISLPPLENPPPEKGPLFIYHSPSILFQQKSIHFLYAIFQLFDPSIKIIKNGFIFILYFSNPLPKYMMTQMLPHVPLGLPAFSLTYDASSIPIVQFALPRSINVNEIINYFQINEHIKFLFTGSQYQILFSEMEEATIFREQLYNILQSVESPWPFFIPHFYLSPEHLKSIYSSSIVCPLEYIFNSSTPQFQQFQQFYHNQNLNSHPIPFPQNLKLFSSVLDNWSPLYSFTISRRLICISFLNPNSSSSFINLDSRWCYAKCSITVTGFNNSYNDDDICQLFPDSFFSIIYKIGGSPPRAVIFFKNSSTLDKFKANHITKIGSIQKLDNKLTIIGIGDFREFQPQPNWYTLSIVWINVLQSPSIDSIKKVFSHFKSLLSVTQTHNVAKISFEQIQYQKKKNQ